jgi:cell wall-associated protease
MTINPQSIFPDGIFKRVATFLISILILTGCGALAPIPKPIELKGKPISKSLELTEQEKKDWFHLDLLMDTIPGLSLNRAYAEIIKDKKGVAVTVAVLDSGMDLEHEDLNQVLWSNTKEIPWKWYRQRQQWLCG